MNKNEQWLEDIYNQADDDIVLDDEDILEVEFFDIDTQKEDE